DPPPHDDERGMPDPAESVHDVVAVAGVSSLYRVRGRDADGERLPPAVLAGFWGGTCLGHSQRRNGRPCYVTTSLCVERIASIGCLSSDPWLQRKNWFGCR